MPTLVDATLRRAVLLLPPRYRTDRGSARVGLAAVRPHLSVVALALAALLGAPDLLRHVPGRGPVRGGEQSKASPQGTASAAGPARTARARLARRPEPAAPGGPVVTVLVANVLLGRADPAALAALVTAERPDLVVLPEAGTAYLGWLLPLLDDHRGWSSVPLGIPDGRGTVVLASARAGDVRVTPGEGMRNPHLDVTGGLLGDRTLHAVHTSAPTNPVRLAAWRTELALIGQWTRATPAPLVAGDLNAVRDHRALRDALGGCRDAAGVGPHPPSGTFPSAWPRWAGIRIDHVLVPRGSGTRRYRLCGLPGSDHRGVLVEVTLPPQSLDRN